MKTIVNILLVIYPVLGQSIPDNSVETLIGCENTTISLSCPVASYVSIVRANYGRFAMAVCNHQVDLDIQTDCGTEEVTTALIGKMCNKLSVCNVQISSSVFPPICPDTQKYLEVQYKCESHVKPMSKIKQSRLPHMEGNISDVWSVRKTVLTVQDVEEAVRLSIFNQNIPFVEKPNANLKIHPKETMESTVHVDQNIGTNVNLLNISENVSFGDSKRRVKVKERRGKSPVHDTLSSSSDSEVLEEGWDMTYHDIVIIIISSSISVILMITTISVIIIKTQTKSKSKQIQKLEMSEISSSSQSACSVYSLPENINRQQLVNFQGCCQFNPEAQLQHELENITDQCCHPHDQVKQAVNINPNHKIVGIRTTHQPSDIFAGVNQNPTQRMCCNCNAHIHYSFNSTPTTTCVGGHYRQSYPDTQNVDSLVQPAVVGNIIVFDV